MRTHFRDSRSRRVASEHPDWGELLVKAVRSPGAISDAYQRFWNYSVGNQLLALFQCMQRGIEPGPIHTFMGWKDLSRRVKKGEKALVLCMPVSVKCARAEESHEAPADALRDPKPVLRRGEIAASVEFEEINCAVDPRHRRPGKRLSPLQVKLPRPPLDDFAWMWGAACSFLIQKPVVDSFREAGFTGFETRSVDSVFKDMRWMQTPELFEFVLTGWGGMAPAKSGVMLKERCDHCGYLQYTMHSDLGAD